VGIASHTGPNVGYVIDGPILSSIFVTKKLPDSKHVMKTDIIMIKAPSIRLSPGLSNKQPQIALPVFPSNYSDSLFNLVQETQS
jgi:hypothetical protein